MLEETAVSICVQRGLTDRNTKREPAFFRTPGSLFVFSILLETSPYPNPGNRWIFRSPGTFLGLGLCYAGIRKKRGGYKMRGYFTGSGFYGLVNGSYVLFASESDYYDALQESEDDAA